MATFDSKPDYLLQTKLYPPRLPDLLVRRQVLLERLQSRGDVPVTLISAPAGYGKSTLVSQWLETAGKPYAWLSLDEYDHSLEAVARYVIAALQTIVPDFGRETQNLLELAQLPGPERLADILLVDLQGLSGPLIFVLDDYHTIANESIHRLLIRLVQRLPHSLRLVIISRNDPPLGLPRLRGKGSLREFRGDDLRFSAEEAAILLEQIAGRSIAAETAELITDQTEGWPVALRMAAMSLRTTEDHDQFTRRYAVGGQKLVSDYLLGEVLERLPDDQRQLLLWTAVVDRLCAPLVDVLAEDSDLETSGYDFLEKLWTSNFFLIALDVQGTWYRYHHLFRELLQQQLRLKATKEETAALHLKASAWFEKAGYIEEAIIHAVKADRPQMAARLVEDNVHQVINQERWRRVDRWIDLLPPEARERPAILAIQAMIEQLRYRLETMIPLLDAAQMGFISGNFDYTPQQEEAWMGVIFAFRATLMLPMNTSRDSLHYAVLAMKQLDPEAVYVRSICEFWHLYALQQMGDPQQAVRLARRKLAGQTGPPDVRTGRLFLALCAIYYAEADLFNLRNMALGFLDYARRSDHYISAGWANYFLGWCAYQENRLDDAERYFSRVLEIRYRVHARAAVDSMTGLALVHGARGDLQSALASVEILREYAMEQGAPNLLPVAHSLAARLDPQSQLTDFLPGQLDQIARQVSADLWELPLLTACSRETARRAKGRLDAVEQTLEQCRKAARSRNAKRQLLRIGGLQTLLHNARGEQEAALQVMEECVVLGEAGGMLRIFVDCGPEFIPYLSALREKGFATPYIDRILAAFPEDVCPTESGTDGDAPDQMILSPTAVSLLADITNREMEVLLLLAERLTNKEIAAELHISPRTVKKHTINLYQKLEVENRRQAVARAREVGIISRRSIVHSSKSVNGKN